MGNILFTGAGFSYNWGGWLATECFEYVLGCPEITPYIRDVLWNHKRGGTGYEGALEQIRAQHQTFNGERHASEIQTFESMLLEMFNSMNAGFETLDFEPGKHERIGPQPTKVRDFLSQFDAIFTVNHDTLLEQKYEPQGDGPNGPWAGFESPGLKKIKNSKQPSMAGGTFQPLPPPQSYQLSPRNQPYFKLHGSSNWVQVDGSSLLIMGGNKELGIKGIPLLDWYRSQFLKIAGRPDTRLMIIGYSFRDEHINNLIAKVMRDGATFFIVDPQGTDALHQSLGHNLFYGTVGASRRLLLPTLLKDDVESIKLKRFLKL